LTTPPNQRGAAVLFRVAIVRLAAFAAPLLSLYIGLQFATLLIPEPVRRSHRLVLSLGLAVLIIASMLLAYRLLVRAVERRSTMELAVRRGARLAMQGVAVGVLLYGVVMGVLALLNMAGFQTGGLDAHIIRAAAAAAMAAVGEELIFRGAIFRILEESMGTLVALVLSGAIFGAAHAANPGATLFSTLAIACEAGVLLGLCYAVNDNLWLPIGVHFGWNFTEGGIFGAAVSGGHASPGVFNAVFAGPDVMTGGRFGPEGSILAVGVSAIASIALAIGVFRTRRWRALSFRMLLD
jgi:membrane protease YdiL (CAAX protease family)